MCNPISRCKLKSILILIGGKILRMKKNICLMFLKMNGMDDKIQVKMYMLIKYT